MISVKNAHQRQAQDGKAFVSLELIGDLELIQSQRTGRFYATAKKCFVASTLSLEQAKQFIGHQMTGKIVRIASDPYDFTVPDTGEVITLCHTYAYRPSELPETTVFKREPPEPDYIGDEIMSQIGE